MKKLTVLTLVSCLSLATSAFASNWTSTSAPNEEVEGATIYYAYTTGQRGHHFAVVCDDRGLAFDLEMRGKRDEGELVDLKWKIDRWSPMIFTGETFPKKKNGYFLTFYDAGSKPLEGTKELVRRARLGSKLKITEADSGELVDQFSLKGSDKAIKEIQNACEDGLGKAPSTE